MVTRRGACSRVKLYADYIKKNIHLPPDSLIYSVASLPVDPNPLVSNGRCINRLMGREPYNSRATLRAPSQSCSH